MFGIRRQPVVATMAASMVVLMSAFPANVQATTTHTIPWGSVFYGPMWNGVDATTAGHTAVDKLSRMGYIVADGNNNTAADKVLRTNYAMDDAVWVAIGHADDGQITIEKGASGGPPQAGIGAVVASRKVAVSPDFSKGPKDYMYDLASNSYAKMKLMAFIGCDTGKNGAAGTPFDGNLVKEAVNDLGADSSIGFTHHIYFAPNATDLWTDAFFTSLRNGKTVTQSATEARGNVFFWLLGFNDTWGFDSPYILGGGTKVYPAGYGS